jgi:hypothetical protein
MAMLSGRRIVRTGAILIGAASALWLTLSLTLAQVIDQPAIALAWQSSNAEAQAARAAQLVSRARPRPAEVREARFLSQAALRREPGNVAAARTLGLVATLSRDPRGAQRLMDYSESLSRRDLPTQLWLIESEVNRNDIRGALRHYDRAMKTSLAARELLYPILVQASGDPAVAGPLGEVMASRPQWWLGVVGQIIAGNPNPATLPAFLRAMRFDLGDPIDRSVLAAGLSRLVEVGQIRPALGLYREVAGARAAQLLRNGGFDEEGGLPPFDWLLTDEPGQVGVVRPREGRDPALYMVAENGRYGPIARQLLSLPPGRYRLTAMAGDVQGDVVSRPLVSIKCANDASRSLSELRIAPADAAGRAVQMQFEVPGGCIAQWLQIDLASPLDPPAVTPWIDAIRLRPL